MKTLLRPFASLLLFLVAALTMSAVPTADSDNTACPPSKNTADSLYEAREYAEAARQYGNIADSLASADVYYNLGNAEYRTKRYAQAVLAYERALRLDPGHEDARYNLTVLRTRLADRFSKPSEMFFVTWLRDFITTSSVEHWVLWSFVWVLCFFVALTGYFVLHRIWLRKVGFFAALFCAFCFVATTGFALAQRHRYYHNADAVITADAVQLYASPTTSSRKGRVIHEGATVTIIDQAAKGWLQIAMPDGSEAYMPDKDYESVAAMTRR